MLSLLRSEWYQARKALSIKIVFGITLAASLVFGFQIMSEKYQEELQTIDRQYFLYGGGSLYGSMEDAAACLLFASLLAGWMIGAAFENRMIQEAVAYGKGRTKVYWAKMLVFLLVCSGICLVYWFGSSLPAFLKNGLGTEKQVANLCHADYIAGMTAAGITAYASLFSICGLIGFFSRKSSITMGICFAVILCGGNLLAAILPDSVLKVFNYTPLGLYHQVLKLKVSWQDIWKTSCISLAWIIGLCGIGLWKFKKAELE